MNPWLSKLCCLFAEQVGGEGSIFVAGHPVRFGDEGQHCTHGDPTFQVGLELQEGGPQASSCRHFFLWQACAVFNSRVITPPSNQVIDRGDRNSISDAAGNRQLCSTIVFNRVNWLDLMLRIFSDI